MILRFPRLLGGAINHETSRSKLNVAQKARSLSQACQFYDRMWGYIGHKTLSQSYLHAGEGQTSMVGATESIGFVDMALMSET